MRACHLALVLAGCGDNILSTPEAVVGVASDGDQVDIVGIVHAVSWDSKQSAAREQELLDHAGDLDYILEQNQAQMLRGLQHAFDDVNAAYPRTTDRYILIRSQAPADVTLGQPGFDATALETAWGLGIHLSDLEPGIAMPEIGARLHVRGTLRHVEWNQRATLPVVEDATFEIQSGQPRLGELGDACTLDQDCNARTICDRATRTCGLPPREIYWADPFHDVNGACDSDTDCPLGQVCNVTQPIAGTGDFAAFYFVTEDVGRHVCVLEPGATIASTCPRIYAARDLVGGRFVTGKEVCIRGRLFVQTPAQDGDSHNQMFLDEPIPYPDPDISYNLFGATTENGPIYKDPGLPGGPVIDPQQDEETVIVGTYRYDPDHGWYEVHPVKRYFRP